MLRNYLLTSIRALRKEKFYVAVNLLSLAMAFALCTIGFFNLMFNYTYNKSFEGYDSIYKINAKPKSVISSKEVGITPLALAEGMTAQFSDLKIGRYHSTHLNVKIGDRFFGESSGLVDPSFLDIIHFQDGLLLGPDDVILTEAAAVRLYGGRAKAKGNTLEVFFPNGESKLLTVREIISVPNQNTSFKFSILVSFEHYLTSYQLTDHRWNEWISGTFVQVNENSRAAVEAALQRYLPVQNEANPELELEAYRLDNIADWAHFERDLKGRSFGAVLHPASVIGTMSSAFAILLLACFNFFNTTIATSGKRLKEISMRKVIGGQRKDIIIQFMMESAFQVFGAFLLSLLISYLLIGPYNAMFRFELIQMQPAYIKPYILFSIGICLLTIILSGAYPAFYISKFRSLDILKNKTKFKGNGLVTKALLAIQFAVCAYNIFGLGVFVENAYYQDKLDRGYDVKNFINIPVRAEQYETLRNEISQNTGLDQVKGTKDLVGFCNREATFVYEGIEYATAKLEVGPGYLQGLGVDFLEGDDFEDGRSSDANQIVINQTFSQQMGGDMLGKWITISDTKYRIKGITADFNIKTIMLSNKIRPTIFFLAPDSAFEYVVVRCDDTKLKADNERIEQLWYGLFPEELYGGFYQEKVFENVNTTNQIMIRINSFIALVSILISILGLYALISLTVQRRIKEIGIRKTLGASFVHVLRLLLNQITWMIGLSLILGLVAGFYVINMLLDIIYAYHIEIDGWNYLFSVITILLSAVVSIGYKVVKTARMNPVIQLRVE
ncbi:MAG: FtsX-like permease family protein [Reichenbachiella sp.]|uniref:ABC transporter permease n=1 Tax=Reichenbachiella sp. TaxID=2184521 RepID=UPI00326779E5